MKTILCTIALATAANCASAEGAGLRISELPLPHHDKPARVAIWYPAEGTGETTTYADSPVFVGVPVRQDAAIAAGEHPVVLFSHGIGGTDRAQAWLGSELAKRGAVVIMVNHPNSTWGDFDMSQGVKHWTRAQDLSAALDSVSAAPEFANQLDLGHVMAAGFSYGGWTALTLGGLIGNHAGFVQTCEDQRATMEACDMLLSDKVQMQAVDPALWNADYSDPRVTQVAAIDPGFVWGLNAKNAEGLVGDVQLIGFGDAQTRMSATNFEDSGLAGLLPDATVVQMPSAIHFTAMPVCTPQGEAILKEEQDDPVCTDPEGTDRAEIHAEIVDALAQQLGL
ncbi:alpha/beta hydrolase family protein [Donghicola mangrovi]|uniref:Dienelactone hydrolase n=1 Tax=Donghicola mangrovi TaxID=2729614 RepID=A0A850Q6I7_9RHOB|nr:hypothetical protein [Donghicola mangrovi]NVO24736.1 hypothetical protein [Donghicola mangrovi]